MNNTPPKNTLFLSIGLILLFFTHSTETSYAINLEVLATVAADATDLTPLPIQLAAETQCPPLLLHFPCSAIPTPLELENSHSFNSATAPETTSSSLKHRFECDQCKKEFETAKVLYAHKRRAHPKKLQKPFKCDFFNCNASFTTSPSLTRHQIDVHLVFKETRYLCEQCGERFKTKGRLKTHSAIHTNVARQFIEKKHLQSSQPSQTSEEINQNREEPNQNQYEEKLYSCVTCKKTFAKEHSLNYHLFFKACNK